MKKLLGSTLALALLVPAGANAELLKNLKVGGSLEVDAVSATNVKDLATVKYDDISTILTRLMVKADWDLLDDVHAHVSIDKNDRTYGGTTGGNTAGASQDLNTIQSKLFVDESYVKIDKLFGALDTTVGRQFYGESGDMVIYFGPKYQLYGMPITALDGARFDWNGEKAGVTLLGSKLAPVAGALGATDSGSINLYGLDVHVKPTDNVSAAAYIYNRITINSGNAPGVNVVANDHLYVAGLKAKVTMGGAWVKAEIAKDFGQQRGTAVGGAAGGITQPSANYTGWAGKANLGYKADISNVGAFTGWGEAAIGSGGATANRNFQAIAGDYRPGQIWGRFATGAVGATLATGGANDTANLSNLIVIGAGVKATPAALSKLTAGLSWYNYRLQTANGVPTAQAGNKFLGNEYDLDLSWAHSENVTVSAGVGEFAPGRNLILAGVAANGTVSSARLGYADLAIKF